MPKKFTEADKRNWLEQSDSGQTEKAIARGAKCDVRTLRRGIEEARRKQDARQARVELVKDALKKHQGELLKELEQILAGLDLPSEGQAPLSWYAKGDSIFNSSSRQKEAPDTTTTKGKIPSYGLRGLLRQHLKQDRLWKEIRAWEKAYQTHIDARMALQLKTVEILEKRTGLTLSDKEKADQPFLYSYTAGNLFYQNALRVALATKPSAQKPEPDITINRTSGDVRSGGLVLAEAPGQEERVRAQLLLALPELLLANEITAVNETNQKLQETNQNVRLTVEQFLLLGLIPGQCEVCRRLGI